MWRWQDKQSPVLSVVPRLPRPEGKGLAPWLPGSPTRWLPAMFGPQAEVWVGREGRRIWGVELTSPLPEPRGREGQLGLEAPRADSDLLLALIGSGESLAGSSAGGRAALCCWGGLEGSREIWRDWASEMYVPTPGLTDFVPQSKFIPRTQFLDIGEPETPDLD